jgi:hypothetical protein
MLIALYRKGHFNSIKWPKNSVQEANYGRLAKGREIL